MVSFAISNLLEMIKDPHLQQDAGLHSSESDSSLLDLKSKVKKVDRRTSDISASAPAKKVQVPQKKKIAWQVRCHHFLTLHTRNLTKATQQTSNETIVTNLEATPSDILFEKPTQQNNDGRFPSIKAATLDRLVERLTYELYTGSLHRSFLVFL